MKAKHATVDMVGKPVWLSMHGHALKARVTHLNAANRYAYGVSWNRADNPKYPFPHDDCDTCASVAHWSLVELRD